MSLKVIYVLNHFLPYQTAGTEVYTCALATEYRLMGWEVIVLVPNLGQNVWDKYLFKGIRVIRYPENSGETREIIQGKMPPDGLSYFQSVLEEEKPDVVHFHEYANGSGIGLWHIKLARLYTKKLIMTMHLAGYSCATGNLILGNKFLCDGKILNYRCAVCYLKGKKISGGLAELVGCLSYFMESRNFHPQNMNNRIGTALSVVHQVVRLKTELREVSANFDYIVCLNDWYRKILLSNNVSDNKLVVIPQALPTQIKKSNTHLFDGTLKLIYIGRITTIKGLDLLIDALLPLDQSKVSLDIYGKEDDISYLEGLKNKTKRCNNISWMGLIPSEEVVQKMCSYDALCLCSIFSEMSPLVIQEACAAKLPVIASRVYGNIEYIRHNINGMLFDYKSVQSLRAIIVRLINNPETLLSLKRNIKQPSEFATIAKKYLNIYTN